LIIASNSLLTWVLIWEISCLCCLHGTFGVYKQSLLVKPIAKCADDEEKVEVFKLQPLRRNHMKAFLPKTK